MVNLAHLLVWNAPCVTGVVLAGRPVLHKAYVQQCAMLANVCIVDNPNLERVTLSFNPNLSRVSLDAPRLRSVTLEHAPLLHTVEPFVCPSAVELLLAELPQLTPETLARAFDHATALRKLTVRTVVAVLVVPNLTKAGCLLHR
jgi:hypothetical protein